MADPPATSHTTPAVFRHRGLLIGLVFFTTALTSRLIHDRIRFPTLERYTALDSRFWLGERGELVGAPYWQLLIPTVLVLFGALIRAWGTSYLRGHIMMDKAVHAERLIISGPFRWCRNPLYVGLLFIAAGYGVYLPPPGLFIAVLLMAGAGWWLALSEERILRVAFGAAYNAYANSVHRFLPRVPGPDVPRGADVEADWKDGLATEAWFVGFALYFVLLALHRSIAAFVVLVLWVGGLLLLRRRHARLRRTGNV